MSKARSVVRDTPLGAASIAFAVLAPCIVLGQLVVGLEADPLLLALSTNPTAAAVTPTLAATILGGWFLLSLTATVQQARRANRSHGRSRLLFGGIFGLLNVSALVAAAAIAASEAQSLYIPGLGLRVPESAAAPLLFAGVVGGIGGVGATLCSLACWPLLSRERREQIWIAADLLLLAVTALALTQLPAEPPATAPDQLGLPVLRHVITTMFALRFLARLMPLILDGIESAGFQALVAARHLRSKKSGFLTVISVLSVLAVTLSSCVLTTTLSVMGGFRQDLKRKILGNNAHVVIDREHGTIEGWEPLLAKVRAQPGVAGASPFVQGEVMISSAANLGTAMLSGIDPTTVGAVNDLPRNMRSGKLEYLTHPEKLLELPPDTFHDSFLPGLKARLADAGLAAGPVTDAGVPSIAQGQTPEKGTADQDLHKRIDALAEFLKADHAPAAKLEGRDVLPGIIIGQELARSLRLYVGDEVNIVAPLGALGPQGLMPKSRPFRVAGIFYSGMYEYDMKFTYAALPTAQRFLGTGEAVSGIEVKVDNVERAPQVAAALRASLGRKSLRVKDWQELNSRLFGALALEKLAMFIALGIAILVASFCIAGTLTLMVQEKGREVAILKAMGTADGAIVGVFVIEGGLIGLLGAALGLFLGYMMCFAVEHFGIRMNPEVYYIDRLPVHIDSTEFALTGIAAIIICLLITIYPALLASRLRPMDALRYE